MESVNDIMELNIKKKCILNFTFCLLLFLFMFQSEGIPADDKIGLSSEGNIYRDLIEKGVATYEDGCRAISCFTDVDEKNLAFDELVSALKEKGIIGKRWKHKAEEPLTRGEIAYMECKVLKISGGLTMRAIDTTKRFAGFVCKKLKINDSLSVPDIGMYKRYAYKESQYMGIIPAGHNKKYVTGHDLLAAMYRIEQYIKAEEKGEKQKEVGRKERAQGSTGVIAQEQKVMRESSVAPIVPPVAPPSQ